MKPSETARPRKLIEKRNSANERRAEIESLLKQIEDTRIEVIDSAKEALKLIRKLRGLSSNNCGTKVIVLEHRQSEGDEPYAVLGRITMPLANGHTETYESSFDDTSYRDVVVEMGAGFGVKPKLPIPEEGIIGQGINGTVWYGDWVSAEPNEYGSESTEVAMKSIRESIDDGELTLDELKELSLRILTRLNSVKESISYILTAAQDKELNLPEDIIPF
jgi:hypothetical protein